MNLFKVNLVQRSNKQLLCIADTLRVAIVNTVYGKICLYVTGLCVELETFGLLCIYRSIILHIHTP